LLILPLLIALLLGSGVVDAVNRGLWKKGSRRYVVYIGLGAVLMLGRMDNADGNAQTYFDIATGFYQWEDARLARLRASLASDGAQLFTEFYNYKPLVYRYEPDDAEVTVHGTNYHRQANFGVDANGHPDGGISSPPQSPSESDVCRVCPAALLSGIDNDYIDCDDLDQ
jgi:hypothetical protein